MFYLLPLINHCSENVEIGPRIVATLVHILRCNYSLTAQLDLIHDMTSKSNVSLARQSFN
jgi:hypothetical protein